MTIDSVAKCDFWTMIQTAMINNIKFHKKLFDFYKQIMITTEIEPNLDSFIKDIYKRTRILIKFVDSKYCSIPEFCFAGEIEFSNENRNKFNSKPANIDFLLEFKKTLLTEYCVYETNKYLFIRAITNHQSISNLLSLFPKIYNHNIIYKNKSIKSKDIEYWDLAFGDICFGCNVKIKANEEYIESESLKAKIHTKCIGYI